MPYTLRDPLITECARSGQMDASQVHQHEQAGELAAAAHRPAHGGFPGSSVASGFVAVPNADYRRLQRQAGEAQTLRLAMSEIVETLDAGGDHPRLVLIGRAALRLKGAL